MAYFILLRFVLHTNIVILWSIFRYLIVHVLIVEKMEGLKLVKDEISQIFIHVD